MQVNADTGAFEGYFGDFFVYHRGFVEVSSDRRTWFFGNRGLSASNLFKFDISGRTATLLQKVSFSGGNGTGLSVSHNSRFLVYPNAGGNGSGYRTFEIPTSDIRSVNGSFIVGASPRAATFSNDDTLLYHGTSSQSAVKIFNTKTFRLRREISLGDSPNGGGGYDTPEVVVDRSGRWLFVATNNYASEPEGDLRVFDTKREDPLPPPQLANLSTRLNVGKDDNAHIGGVIITGNEPKKLMVRAIGPSLTEFGIAGTLGGPVLELYDSEGTVLATNDNWQTTVIGGSITTGQAQQIKNSSLAPKRAAESALIATLPAGAYTAIVRGKDNTTGIGLVETYDLDPTADSKLANISTRGFVEPDPNAMIAGTIVTGNVSARVLVRALGPSLTEAGLSNVLEDPTIELYNGYACC